jgi:hypothetical protein
MAGLSDAELQGRGGSEHTQTAQEAHSYRLPGVIVVVVVQAVHAADAGS